MNKNVSAASLAIIKKMQQNELTESVIYERIAKFAKGEENKQTLLRLSQEEHAHNEIWKKYTGLSMKPEKLKILKYNWTHFLRMATLIADLLSIPIVMNICQT